MTTSRGSRRLRGALVVVEVAISMVLLVGAALMTRTLVSLYHADRGIDPAGLVDVKLGLPAAGYTDVATRDAFIQSAVERARQLPGVSGAAAGVAPPANSQVVFGALTIAGAAQQDPGRVILPVYTAGPGYFETLRLPMVEGRPFATDDLPDSVVVNQSFARRYWPAGHAVGGEFRLEAGPWLHVVGIAADVRRLEPGAPKVQLQIYQPPNGSVAVATPILAASTIAEYRTIVVRVDDPVKLTTSLPGAIHAIDPTVVVWKIDAVEHLFADSIARPRVVFAVMSVFAGFGLLLAAAGLYGVLSYLVSQRRREIGIRIALGARPARVGLMVVRSGLLLTATGLAIGLASALALVRVMQTLLYNVQPSDPLSVVAVTVVVAGAALTACWRPARQAMRVDPLSLLRTD